MDHRALAAVFAFMGALALAAGPEPAGAQTRIGQYEDEAPLRTWNAAPFTLATALGRGGTAMTAAADPSAAFANPALLPLLPRFSVAVEGVYEAGMMAKAGPIGTGVFLTDGNVAAGGTDFDYAGAAGRAGRWGFALGVAQEESYLRPAATYAESAPPGGNGYLVEWSQSGRLRIVNAAAGVILGGGFSAGLGVNAVFGRRDRSFVERITGPRGWEVSDRTGEDIRGWFLNGGLLWSPSSRFRAAAVFRTPYSRRIAGDHALGYAVPDGNTDIRLATSSTDTARQPLSAGLGASLDVSPAITLALEATYFNWAAYKLDVFGEAQDRAFRNVVRLNAGFEIRETITLFGTDFAAPTRLGLIYDPQPAKDPASAYGCATIGTGLAAGRFRIDLAGLFGREWGSGYGLIARRIALTLQFRI